MSIKALNWATEIYVGDGVAKSVLRAIANYADENGHCYPSHRRLALDTEFSPDTVKRRIAQLEQWGFLVSFRCWMDENGVRNKEERGRETSRELRLALNKTPEHPSESGDAEASKPDVVGGVMGGADCTPQGIEPPVQPAPLGEHDAPPPHAGVLPPNEPSLNQKIPPSPPRGDVHAPSAREESEPEHFAEFYAGYPGHQVMRRDLALAKFRLMTPTERLHARAAVPLLSAELARMNRKPRNAHLWLEGRGWIEFPNAQLPLPRVFVPENSDAFRSLLVGAEICGLKGPSVEVVDGVSGYWRKGEVPADLAALAAFHGQRAETWDVAVEGSREYFAWRDRIQLWTGAKIPARSVNGKTGFPVPCRWPPRKDGTIADGAAA